MEAVQSLVHMSIGEEPKKRTLEKIRPRKKRVLIVDDDPDFAELLKYNIEKREPQMTCVTISDPYEAVISLTDENFEVIYIDQNMPGLNGDAVIREADRFIGYDTTAQMKKSSVYKTPVVLMSGRDLDQKRTNFSFFEIKEKVNKREFALMN